jgi:hypothetical protein
MNVSGHRERSQMQNDLPATRNDSAEHAASCSDGRLGCQCIDWYHEGEERIVEVGGVQVTVRFVGRKGRRGRIAITAKYNGVRAW